jgi:hypothetical protein
MGNEAEGQTIRDLESAVPRLPAFAGDRGGNPGGGNCQRPPGKTERIVMRKIKKQQPHLKKGGATLENKKRDEIR